MEDEQYWVLRAKECGICNQEFDEASRCPRLLPCSHCICTYCVKRLLEDNSKFCPFCRQEFRQSSEQDFRVNTCVLDLLRYASNLEAGAVFPNRELSSSEWLNAFQNSKDAAIKDNLALCQKANDLIINGVQLNEDFIRELKNAATVERERKAVHWRAAILFFEEKNIHLESEKDMIEHKQQQMEQTTEKLSLATTLGDAGEALDKIAKTNREISSGLRVLSDLIAKDEEVRQRLRQILENGNVDLDAIQEVLTSEGSGDLVTQFTNLDLSVMGENPRQIETQDLLQMSPTIKRLVRRNKVFALQQLGGQNRFAKISYTEEGKLCQHTLTDEIPPPGSYVTKFSGLSSMDPTSTLAFIEVTSQKSFMRYDGWGTPMGQVDLDPTTARLYVRLFRNDLRSQQFLYLCTGELAPSSYLGVKVSVPFKFGAPIRQVRFGDYGDRGKAIVPGVSQEGRDEKDSFCEAGTLVGRRDEGDDLGAQFYIRLSHIEDFPCDQSFGRVQEGMDALRRVLRFMNEIGYQMRDFVSDCGVVLSS
ncbi:uncharacterized protein LOC135200103 [Macrobrachium nipponense]|uniref:uncharacterized protein LOC135200103 n=1 Tax=Macrobrachium nipponense TaxID=159736 RepID=UPI0030C86F75